jgi:hypothetical protein
MIELIRELEKTIVHGNKPLHIGNELEGLLYDVENFQRLLVLLTKIYEELEGENDER